jgi:hypothetical protein
MKQTTKRPKTPTSKIEKPPAATDDMQERMRRHAYALWQRGGCVHGSDVAHWLQAEQELAVQESK